MYRKKAIYALLVLLVLFGCSFMIALASLLRQSALLGIGLGYKVEGWVTIVFSIIGIIRVLFEIVIIERS